MFDQKNVVALIPARSGSKGVVNKNIRLVGGHPIIAFTIVAAKMCKKIDRVIVTTDSQDIADVAFRYGAEVPFLRPAELSTDHSGDFGYVNHAIDILQQQDGYDPGIILQLRPTTPLRDPKKLDSAIDAIRLQPDATSLRSVQELSEPPQKMMGIENNFLCGLFPDDTRPEYYNLPRQSFAPAFLPNGYVDIIRSEHVKSTQTLYGPKVLAFKTATSFEIDTLNDLEYLEFTVEKHGHPLLEYLNKY